MTLRELANVLGVSRNVAAKLAAKIPGAKREAQGPGRIQAWVLPDDCTNLITEDMVEAARVEAGTQGSTSPGPPSSDPDLRQEDLALRRTRLAADRTRIEAERLRAEADLHKAQEDLDRLRARDRDREPRPQPDRSLADRLAGLERKIDEAARRPDGTATAAQLITSLVPLLGPIVERLASSPPLPPTPQLFSPTDLLGLAEKIKALVDRPEVNLRQEIRGAYRDGLEDGQERATARQGEGAANTWAELAKSVPELMKILPDILRFAGQRTGLVPPQLGPPQLGPTPQPVPGGAAPSIPPSGPPSGWQPAAPPTGPPVEAQQPTPPAFQQIFDALITELAKPQPDVEGVAAFLNTITINPSTGETLLDHVDGLAQAPEELAVIGLKGIHPGLVAPTILPGVKKLLAYLREEAQREAEQGPAPAPAAQGAEKP